MINRMRFAGLGAGFLLTLVSVNAGAQNIPPWDSPKCPLSCGNWHFVAELSDEFSGRSLDTSKLYPFNPGWKGRPPGYFSPGNVKVKQGKLILTSRTETLSGLPEEYHTFTAAAVKSKQRMLYGYYELRLFVVTRRH